MLFRQNMRQFVLSEKRKKTEESISDDNNEITLDHKSMDNYIYSGSSTSANKSSASSRWGPSSIYSSKWDYTAHPTGTWRSPWRENPGNFSSNSQGSSSSYGSSSSPRVSSSHGSMPPQKRRWSFSRESHWREIAENNNTYGSQHSGSSNNDNNVNHSASRTVIDLAPDVLASAPGLAGFMNIGNTCFMNSSLQMLSSVMPLVESLVGHRHMANRGTENDLFDDAENARPESLSGITALHSSLLPFSVLANRMAKSDESVSHVSEEERKKVFISITLWYTRMLYHTWMDNGEIIDTTQFVKCMNLHKKMQMRQFADGSQHDVQEFITCFVDQMHEDIAHLQGIVFPRTTTTDESTTMLPAADSAVRTIISDLFQGQAQSTITCRVCGWSSSKTDAYTCVTLPLVSMNEYTASQAVLEKLASEDAEHIEKSHTTTRPEPRPLVFHLFPDSSSQVVTTVRTYVDETHHVGDFCRHYITRISKNPENAHKYTSKLVLVRSDTDTHPIYHDRNATTHSHRERNAIKSEYDADVCPGMHFHEYDPVTPLATVLRDVERHGASSHLCMYHLLDNPLQYDEQQPDQSIIDVYIVVRDRGSAKVHGLPLCIRIPRFCTLPRLYQHVARRLKRVVVVTEAGMAKIEASRVPVIEKRKKPWEMFSIMAVQPVDGKHWPGMPSATCLSESAFAEDNIENTEAILQARTANAYAVIDWTEHLVGTTAVAGLESENGPTGSKNGPVASIAENSPPTSISDHNNPASGARCVSVCWNYGNFSVLLDQILSMEECINPLKFSHYDDRRWAYQELTSPSGVSQSVEDASGKSSRRKRPNKDYALSELLRVYTTRELLGKTERYTCEACQVRRDTYKKITISQCPPYLIINLKRFEFDLYGNVRSKITSPVEYPTGAEILDMAPYMTEGTTTASSRYRLQAVIMHSGSAHGGHYVADVLRQNGMWYRCDDSRVYAIDGHRTTRDAYVLLYTLEDTKEATFLQ